MSADAKQQEHLKIADDLMRKIMNDELAAGEKVPSITELADTFRVYRSVAERALKRLENLGWLTPVHGKGYFVNKKPEMISSLLTRHNRRYTNLMLQLGEKPNSHLLDWRLDEPNAREREILQLSPGEQVYRLEILRFAREAPMTIATSSLPARVVPDFERYLADFRSLHGILQDHYQFEPIRKFTVIEARMPLNRDADLLEIPENIPVLWRMSLNVHPNGTPVELVIARLRGDRYQCVVDFEQTDTAMFTQPMDTRE